MIAMIPFLFGVIGLAIGAFAAYAAGGKNRQAAKHYKKITNELSDKYTNLEKVYHQLTDENTKKFNELNQAREVIAQNTQIIDELTSRYDNLEQEYHQITDENKQHLDNLANSQQLITKNNHFISELNDKFGNLQKKYDEIIAENTTQKELITEKTKIINELNDRHTNLQIEFEETTSKNQQYLTDLNKCKQLINKNQQDINELTNKYSNLQKKYHQLNQENKQNIEKLSDAGELIAQKTKTIDELIDKYAKLEQEYHHLATENTQYIDAFTYDSDLVDLLVAFEKESLGLAVELHQSVISLMCEIHREATAESIDDLKSLVEEANQFLEEIKENLIIIPDDYYETLLESVRNNNREPLPTDVLSIDLGRTSTKVCVSRDPGNVAFIPANIKQIPFADIFYGDIDKYRISLDPIDPLIDVWLEHQGSGYILGQMAAECGANLGVGQSKLEDALVKVLAAAGYFKLKDEISVVISLPFFSLEKFEIEKAQLVSMITGPHLFNFRGESVCLNITKVWVMPNGYGSLLWSEAQPTKLSTMPDLKKICLAIIDIGHQTIDMVMVDNFRFARGASKSEDFGMSKFYELIAHEIEGADSQSLRLIAAVNKPKGKRFYRPQDAWIATNLDDFLPNLTEQFSRETSARILAWLPERVTDVIITGGGGEFFWEDLQRLLKEARVNAYLTAPSRQANTLGQYIYGEAQLRQQIRAFRTEE